ncbi:MAG: ArdC family protein [Thermoguttaceae bacterium]
MPSQSQIRDEVTQKIVAALEADLLPWRRPWNGGAAQPGRHSNVASRNPYSGLNPMLLEIHAIRHGLLSRWWGTFNQWHGLGCRVCRRPPDVEEGHWGARIIFYQPMSKTVLNTETGDEDEERFFVLKTFTVFSADQVEGDAAEELRAVAHDAQTDAQPDFAPAEELISATGADIRFGGNRAYYSRPLPVGAFPHHASGDYIVIPPRATFDPPGAFYETAIHEIAHWSEVRTGWNHEKNGYALGEMVAEIASTYVSTELGIPQGETLGNHAAYVKNWLDAMRGDRNYIFRAAKQASRITDYLLGFVKQPEPEAVGAVK